MIESIYIYGVVAAAAYFLARAGWNMAVDKRDKLPAFVRDSQFPPGVTIAALVFVGACLYVMLVIFWPVSIPVAIAKRFKQNEEASNG